MDGIIIINKQKNCTSHDVVRKIKKITNEKVGHTGTLDPMVTGVLPLLIGKATLCSKYLINHDKKYEVTLKLGIKTDTADLEGSVLEEKNVSESALEERTILKALNSFLGKQEQIPPMYSAIKVNGKKLYEYARKGQKIEVKPRQIEIYEMTLIKIDGQKQEIKFEVHCSKGTYIRSLCEDIAQKLGTIGIMSELKRLQVGKFEIQDTIEMEDVEEQLEQKLIKIEDLFADKEQIILSNKKLELFLNGVMLNTDRKDDIFRIYNNDTFIGIGVVKDKILKRDIIL